MRSARWCSSLTDVSGISMGVSIGRVCEECEVVFLCDSREWHMNGCEHREEIVRIAQWCSSVSMVSPTVRYNHKTRPILAQSGGFPNLDRNLMLS